MAGLRPGHPRLFLLKFSEHVDARHIKREDALRASGRA
jgi:hypothetical protein